MKVIDDEGNLQLLGMPRGSDLIGGEEFDRVLHEWVKRELERDDPEPGRRSPPRPSRGATSTSCASRCGWRKKILSRLSEAEIELPAESERGYLSVTREQFEQLIQSHASGAVDLLTGALSDAKVDSGDLDAIYLCGGTSEVPLVQQLLTERFGAKLRLDEPKLISLQGVAEALADGHAERRDPGTGTQVPTQPAPATSAGPPGRTSRVAVEVPALGDGMSSGTLVASS